jgi:hypothetical protein
MFRFILIAVISGCGGYEPGAAEEALSDDNALNGKPEPNAHVHYQRGQNGHTGGGGGSALMSLHGGDVMPTNNTYAIWWGSQWSSANFAGDKITGMERFFRGMNGSNYAGTGSEYAGVDGVSVSKTSQFQRHYYDTSSAPNKALSIAGAVAEACKATNNAPDPAGIYFIYTATGAGHVNYCAWHSFGNCATGGAPVQVAYMPNIDNIAGCDPQDDATSPVHTGAGHSQGLAALANVTAHELLETMTDPRNGGWYDQGGGEDGDKCAWSFTAAVPLSYTDSSNVAHPELWKLQQEWSNAAYSAGNGNLNTSGQPGCLQGN